MFRISPIRDRIFKNDVSTGSPKASSENAEDTDWLQDLQVGVHVPFVPPPPTPHLADHITRGVWVDKCIGYAELNVMKESLFVRDVSNLEQIVTVMKSGVD